MTKRIVTLTLVLLLLLSPATGITGTFAQTTGSPTPGKAQLNEEKIKAEVLQAIVNARRNATYDKAGRMSKVTIELPAVGKFDFEYKYDEQNRVQYIVDSKGRRTKYEYGEKGTLSSITLPNGIRMYELDKDGKGIFFKDGIDLGKRNAGQKLPAGISGLSLVRVAMMDEEMGGSECTRALYALGIAAASAAVACAGGVSTTCVSALAAVALAASTANNACKSNAFEPVWGPES
jgi:YD repeat-containing protein